MADANKSSLLKDEITYVRDLLRNDNTLMVSILGLSGTTDSVNHVFAGRPRDERVNSDGIPNFKLPRIVVDFIDGNKTRIGNNQNGFKQTTDEFQVAHWTPNTSWSTSFDAQERIRILLEETTMSVEEGYSTFEIFGGSIIDDPDRPRTKQGTVNVRIVTDHAP